MTLKPYERPKRQLPQHRVLRRRIAARTTGIHVSALPHELDSLASLADGDGFLMKSQIPEEHRFCDEAGVPMYLSRDAAWKRADRRAQEMEWNMLSGRGGKIAVFFSAQGQGVFGSVSRQTLVFSGFFHDYLEHAGEASQALSRRGSPVTPTSGIAIGPIIIALDAAAAAGLTALGHVARGAPMGDRVVITDVVSTGAYEGTSAYAAAKLGVLAGTKAMIVTATAPILGASTAAFATGFLVGAITAATGKTFLNIAKNIAVDHSCGKLRGSGQPPVPG